MVTATISDKIRKAGTLISITFNNFSIDTIGVSGTMVVGVTNANISGTNVTFIDSVKNGVLTFPSGTISFSSAMTVDWTLNNTISDYTDDEFTISNCSISGTNKDSTIFTATVTQNLLLKASCQEIVSGAILLNTASISYPATIDFGTGICDGVATVTTTIKKQIGLQTIEQSYSYTIDLP